MGKTLWARSLGRHWYWNGQYNYDNAVGDPEYAIFDDMNGGFSFLHNWKGWLGLQQSLVVTDKFKKKMDLEWGKPTIWLCNDDPRFCDSVMTGATSNCTWLEANCTFVEITEDRGRLIPEEPVGSDDEEETLFVPE